MGYSPSSVADKVSDSAEARQDDGGRPSGGDPTTGGTAVDRIRSKNEELLRRTGQHLQLALTVLTEQRDEALRDLASADERSAKQRAELCDEQDRFITFLMEDHDKKVEALSRELTAAKQELERRRALTTEPASSRSGAMSEAEAADADHEVKAAREQVDSLKQLLESAQAEVEDTRADAVRLQEERDEAIRATDDIRLEMIGEVEAARDETFQLQTQLDDAYRQVEDARDEARDEAYRASEERSELQRELDERNDQVRRLRARLAELTVETKPSQPPPPAALKELQAARLENQSLRKQLIDAKRELSRASREAGLTRTSRGRRSGALALRAGQDTNQSSNSPGREPTSGVQPGSTGAKPSHAGPAELKPAARKSSTPAGGLEPPRPGSPAEPTKPT